jgi:hypothetical protein
MVIWTLLSIVQFESSMKNTCHVENKQILYNFFVFTMFELGI